MFLCYVVVFLNRPSNKAILNLFSMLMKTASGLFLTQFHTLPCRQIREQYRVEKKQKKSHCEECKGKVTQVGRCLSNQLIVIEREGRHINLGKQ